MDVIVNSAALEEAIKKLTEMAEGHPEVGMLITFLTESERGIVR